MLPERVSAVLYVANVVAVVHMVADNVVYSHGSRHRSAPVRSGASQFARWAPPPVGCEAWTLTLGLNSGQPGG